MTHGRRGATVLPLAILTGVAFALLLLGAWWSRDRMRRWEEPSWTWREFVALAGGPGIDGASELHLVPVNPRCPHCAGHLARALAESRAQGGVRVEALIVDTPKPPAAAAFASVAVDGWWWDARDTWRRRWGHRVYGEVLIFDRSGRYRGTLPPRPG